MLMKMEVGLDQSRFHTISAVATGGRERGQGGGPTPGRAHPNSCLCSLVLVCSKELVLEHHVASRQQPMM